MTETAVQKNNNNFLAITALWAFVESGLGGMMHALHLPFTGIFLGGFSVIAISLLAQSEAKPYRQIMKATLIVMAIKASVNPMTSGFAYIAVGFQGLLGALLYSLPFRNKLLSYAFASIAMLESAFQKLLIMTIIFGESWYKAIDKFFFSILKSLKLDNDAPFAFYIVSIYLLIYFLWGLTLGFWINILPQQLEERKHLYDELEPEIIDDVVSKGKKKKKLPMLLIFSVLIFISAFLVPDDDPYLNALTLIFRTLAVVIIWILIVAPLWKRFIIRQLEKNKQIETPLIVERLPYLKMRVKPLYRLISSRYKGLERWKEFVLGIIVIGLKNDESKS